MARICDKLPFNLITFLRRASSNNNVETRPNPWRLKAPNRSSMIADNFYDPCPTIANEGLE